MNLKMIDAAPGRRAVVVCCDACGDVIRHMGAAVFVPAPAGHRSDIPVRIVHKDPTCFPMKVDEQWLELDRLLLNLIHNSGYELEESLKRQGRLDELG